MRETTALGAAIAAGFAIGLWKDLPELKNINRENRTSFSPQIPDSQRQKMYERWEWAVKMSTGWSSEGEGCG